MRGRPGRRRRRARATGLSPVGPCRLARRLPSLGAGAWRLVPLLPWRVQCPGRVCAALAAGSGGSGRYLVSCLPRFPLPGPRVLRCVWRAVPSGCSLPSLAGTPLHAVCAFRGPGPVALLVFPACPLCACALPLPRRPLRPPPPPLVVVAPSPRAVPVLDPGRAVPCGPCPSACPASVPCSVWLARGGGRPGPVSPLPGLGLCAPCGVALGVWNIPAPGGGLGGVGGGGLCAVPPDCAAGGASGAGGRLASVRPSAFPGQATKQVLVPGVALAMEGVAPIPLQFVFACCPRARFVWCPVSLLFVVPAAAGIQGVEAGPAPASLRGAAFLPGGGSSPLPRGGWGPAPPWLAGRWGGWGDRGGVAPWPPFSLSGGGGLRLPTQPPFRRRPIPPWRTRSVGVAGQPRAPGAACRWRASLAGGGGEVRPVNRPSGGSNRPRPSLCPPWAGNVAGVIGDALVMGGAAPILLRFVVACRPRAWPVRRSGALVRARLPVAIPAGAGSGGRGGARPADPAGSPPGRHGPFCRRGDLPSAPGGAKGRRSRGPQALGGERGGEGGGGGAVPLLPATLPCGVARGPRPCHPLSPARPLGVHTCSRGCRAAVGTGRGPVGRRWVSVAGWGGGRGLPAPVSSPASPRLAPQWAALCAHSWAPPFCCRSAAGNVGVSGRSTGGAWRAAALAAAVVSSPRVQRPPRGVRGRCPSDRLPSAYGLGGGGGERGVPWSPYADPRRPRGGGLVVLALGGQPPTGGAHFSTASLYPLGAGPSHGPPAPPAVATQCRLAGGGGG